MTATETEYRGLQAEKQIAITWQDIAMRYGCGIVKARTIIQAIRACCGGGKLPRGKVLPAELEYWESVVIKKQVRI